MVRLPCAHVGASSTPRAIFEGTQTHPVAAELYLGTGMLKSLLAFHRAGAAGLTYLKSGRQIIG
jgi:hypothetical protein